MTKRVTKEGHYEVTDLPSVSAPANKVPVALTAEEITKLDLVLGARGFCSDSVHNTFTALVEGGGNNVVPVYCDGSNWRVG